MGEATEIARDCLFLGSKITADGDCSHEIKRRLLLGRKTKRSVDGIVKSRDVITLPTQRCYYFADKDLSSQSYGFVSSHVYGWMWELNHKEIEYQKTDAFELWCWRRLLRVPWTAKRSNQSILKEISPEYSLEYWSWSSSTLAWCEELTHWKRPWCWERLKAGGEGDDRGWDGWMASPTRWTWVSSSPRSWWSTGNPGVLQSMGSQRAGDDWMTELTNWPALLPSVKFGVGLTFQPPVSVVSSGNQPHPEAFQGPRVTALA